MFLSKIPSLLGNILTKTQYNPLYVTSVSRKLNTTALVTTESSLATIDSDNTTSLKTQELPDKLYRLLELEMKANDPAILRSYGTFTAMAAKELEIKMSRNYAPPKPHFQRWNLLKSVHIYKKHQVHYEIRTYFRFMTFMHLTGSTADTFLEYIQRNLPEGVALTVTKTEIQPLPIEIS